MRRKTRPALSRPGDRHRCAEFQPQHSGSVCRLAAAPADLLSVLRLTGVANMASESHYGLSLVLGGGEVTAQELAKLYALLANRGELRPLRMQLNETESTPVRLLSEEASFITLDMLRQHRRPGDTLAQRSSSLPVYWKTGTSWLSRRLERRDFRPLRAGGVGRQLRRARQQCVGRRRGGRAAVLQYHRQRQRQLPRPAGTEAPVPQRLRRADICLASGDLPTPWCQQKGKTWFIPGKSPIKVDSVYRPVVLDIHSGEVVCPPYDAAQTRTEILSSGLPIWPTYSPRPGCRSGRRRSTAARTTVSPSAATRRASLRR